MRSLGVYVCFSCNCCTDGEPVPVELKAVFRARRFADCKHIIAGLLSKKHPYYTQTQFQIFVMRTKMGFFVTFVNGKTYVQKIPADTRLMTEFEALVKKL